MPEPRRESKGGGSSHVLPLYAAPDATLGMCVVALAGGGMRRLAVLGVLAVLLAACSQHPVRSPAMLACMNPLSARSALQRRIEACTSLIRTAKGDDLGMVLRERAGAYRLTGNAAAALQDLNQALALRPTDAEALDGRGLIYLDGGDLAKATADFNQAIRLQPGGQAGYNNRGAVERRQGDFAAALRDENRAIELGPESPNPWANRGLIFLARHRYGLALADFADALRRDQTLVYAIDGAGDAFLGRGDVAHAVAAYNDAATADFDAQNYRAAIAESDKALAAKPNDPTSLNNRCWTRGVGNFELDLAMADCALSLKLRPGDANTLDSEAMVYFREGKIDDAIAGYDAALAKDPKLAPSMFMRGIAKIRAGEVDDGHADIDDATALDTSVAATFAGYGISPKPPPGAPPAAGKGDHALPSTNAAQ
jgi:tetratricopeptide (TPR) repeat protein